MKDSTLSAIPSYSPVLDLVRKFRDSILLALALVGSAFPVWAAGSAAVATTASAATAGSQTQSPLNYPFALLDIRENNEIVDTGASSQSAPP